MHEPADPGTDAPAPSFEAGRAEGAQDAKAPDELAREAAYLDLLYRRLAEVQAQQQRRLAEVRLAPRGGTPQARTERDVLARELERRLAALAIGDLPLCFGRLDLDDKTVLYVGRVGLASEDGEPLLVDWRAPKAALFYRASAGSPEGVLRRRHFLTRGRRLVAIEDEVFDVEALKADELAHLRGDAALLAELSRARTGHMRDIVATIQREQDAIIRSELAGALVVQGGPGTGKTAVGLHRAAYLLYAHRGRLAESGVLILGPNSVFLRYIEQVLPALGETGALMTTVRSLFPGIRTSRHDEEAVAELKSRPVMARLIANAIRDRQRPPRGDVELIFERHRIVLSKEVLTRAQERGRRPGRHHNEARRAVEATVVEAALSQLRNEQARMGLAPTTPEEQARLRRSLARSAGVRALLERIWPVLTPQQLLNDLFGFPALIRSAARGLPEVDARLLVRERALDPDQAPWTIEDVPLLDEAAAQLGSWTSAAQRRAERRRAAERRRQVDYARSVLHSLHLGIEIDPEQLVERFAEAGRASIAEQAATDPTWRFGHVIVDEAQELSAMAWRAVFRRAPSRSMTVLGDLAQGGAPWTPPTWSAIFDTPARGRWRLAELSTNYRTPAEIMAVANAVLAVAAPEIRPTVAVRSSGHLPRRRAVQLGELPDAVAEAAARLAAEIGEGRVAVLAEPVLLDSLRGALALRLGSLFDDADPLAGRIALLAVADAKGLEFDAVVLVEPGEIARHGPRGLNDLYVALTRATQRLLLVHARPLTPELEATVATFEGHAGDLGIIADRSKGQLPIDA
jgi:DNA helicase IV